MSKRDLNWIIKIGPRYLKHPRGEWTTIKNDAFGFHYKKDCDIESRRWDMFYLYGLNQPSDMICKAIPIGSKTSIMRREDATDL